MPIVRPLALTAALGCALVLAAVPAPAQEEAPEARTETSADAEPAAPAGAATWEEIVDALFSHLKAGEAVEGLDAVYATNPRLEEMFAEQVAQAREQFAVLTDVAGEYLGTERLAVQPIGERFVYVWQAGYFEHQPIQFHFSLYRPKDSWFVTTFSYDQQLNDTARAIARQKLIDR